MIMGFLFWCFHKFIYTMDCSSFDCEFRIKYVHSFYPKNYYVCMESAIATTWITSNANVRIKILYHREAQQMLQKT